MITLDIKDLNVNTPINEAAQITRYCLTHNSVNKILQHHVYIHYLILYIKISVLMTNFISPPNLLIWVPKYQFCLLKYFYILKIWSLNNIKSNHIIFYTRYVDNIWNNFDNTKITSTRILHYANTIHTNLKFKLILETDAFFNILGLLLQRTNQDFETEVYRKPTSTAKTIYFHPNHPIGHKLAAFRFLLSRMRQLPLTPYTNKKNGTQFYTLRKLMDFPVHISRNSIQ